MGGTSYITTGVERNISGDGANHFALAQAEVGFRLASGPFFFRLDLDLQAVSRDPDGTAFGWPNWAIPGNGLKFGPPEFAMLQIGREDYHLRLGIITRMIGYEDWELSNNLFPTYSTMYNGVAGRFLGVEPGLIVGNGYEINLAAGIDFDYGGLDTDCGTEEGPNCLDGLTFSLGLTTLQDYWATWSGLVAYPVLENYSANLAFEFYPLDQLWFALDGNIGVAPKYDDAGEVAGLRPYAGGELTLNILPESVVHPAVRVQGLFDSENAFAEFIPLQLPSLSASGVVIWTPFDELKLSLEGKVSKYDDQIVPGMFAFVALRRPEPPPYDVKDPEEEPAEEAPAAAKRSWTRERVVARGMMSTRY